MPIYDYRCKECNTDYDVLHLGKEIAEDVKCPACGSNSHIRLISAPSIQTKGNSMPCRSRGTCSMDRSCCSDVCGAE